MRPSKIHQGKFKILKDRICPDIRTGKMDEYISTALVKDYFILHCIDTDLYEIKVLDPYYLPRVYSSTTISARKLLWRIDKKKSKRVKFVKTKN
jgi:hypothetical protein